MEQQNTSLACWSYLNHVTKRRTEMSEIWDTWTWGYILGLTWTNRHIGVTTDPLDVSEELQFGEQSENEI